MNETRLDARATSFVPPTAWRDTWRGLRAARRSSTKGGAVNRRFMVVVLACVVAVPLFAMRTTGALAAVPSNDNPGSGAALPFNANGDLPGNGGYASYEFDTSEATSRPVSSYTSGDPRACADYGHSVWYRYKPTNTPQRLRIDTRGSSYDTVLAVYTTQAVRDGTAWNSRACNDNANGTPQSELEFDVVDATDYYRDC